MITIRAMMTSLYRYIYHMYSEMLLLSKSIAFVLRMSLYDCNQFQTKTAPKVSWPADKCALYTLMMLGNVRFLSITHIYLLSFNLYLLSYIVSWVNIQLNCMAVSKLDRSRLVHVYYCVSICAHVCACVCAQ